MTQITRMQQLNAVSLDHAFYLADNDHIMFYDDYLDWFKINEPEAYRRFLEAWNKNEVGQP